MEKYWSKAMNYCQYRSFIDSLVRDGKTSGNNQTEKLIKFTKLNLSRMRKWEKNYFPGKDSIAAFDNYQKNELWLILTEAWCGDAAQNIPQIEKIAQLSFGIQTRYILRDENPELMQAFLTNGTRSIPKLIRLSPDFEVLGTWGPRPSNVQKMVYELKFIQNLTKDEVSEKLHSWYNENKGVDLEHEFSKLIQQTKGASC